MCAVNSICADALHPSAIGLEYLQGGQAEAPLPACDPVLNQPCRPNQAAIRAGTMTVG